MRRSGSPTQFARSARCAAAVALFIAALAHAAAPALEGRWTLVDRTALGGAKGDRGPDITLEIKGDSLSASAGCNLAGGSIKERGGRLEIGLLAATMMACPPAVAKLEARYFDMLQQQPAYRLEGSMLTLSAAGSTFTFRRMPTPGATAETKLVYVAAERKDCAGVAPMQCLQVRQQKTEPWTLFHGEIAGFEPQPGIEYRLRIFEETVPKPPADGSSRRWVLDQVIEQRVVKPPR